MPYTGRRASGRQRPQEIVNEAHIKEMGRQAARRQAAEKMFKRKVELILSIGKSTEETGNYRYKVDQYKEYIKRPNFVPPKGAKLTIAGFNILTDIVKGCNEMLRGLDNRAKLYKEYRKHEREEAEEYGNPDRVIDHDDQGKEITDNTLWTDIKQLRDDAESRLGISSKK